MPAALFKIKKVNQAWLGFGLDWFCSECHLPTPLHRDHHERKWQALCNSNLSVTGAAVTKMPSSARNSFLSSQGSKGAEQEGALAMQVQVWGAEPVLGGEDGGSWRVRHSLHIKL